MAIVGNNQDHEERLSEIDIDSVSITNQDPTVYQDKKMLEVQRLELSAEANLISQQSDGTYHPGDLMAHKMQEHLETENRRALTFLNSDDDKMGILFKHYQTTQSHMNVYDELISKARRYRQDEGIEGAFSMKTSEIKDINRILHEIYDTSDKYSQQLL